MTLSVGYQLEDTCCRCCYVLIGGMCFAEDVVAADAIVVKALVLKDPIPVDEGAQLLTAALPRLLFLARSAAA
jgi:hypothetical protein